jgi:hypothetical protein
MTPSGSHTQLRTPRRPQLATSRSGLGNVSGDQAQAAAPTSSARHSRRGSCVSMLGEPRAQHMELTYGCCERLRAARKSIADIIALFRLLYIHRAGHVARKLGDLASRACLFVARPVARLEMGIDRSKRHAVAAIPAATRQTSALTCADDRPAGLHATAASFHAAPDTLAIALQLAATPLHSLMAQDAARL